VARGATSAFAQEWSEAHRTSTSRTSCAPSYSLVVDDEPQLSEFEKFKWNTVGDAVFEDYRGFRSRCGGCVAPA
jgi:hypothetical protein